jgi:Zn finger protein HypA/HybF involved in hydrogenase expression
MKRIDFIKLSAMSALIVPNALMGRSSEQVKQQIKPEAIPLFCSTCGTQFVDDKYTAGNCPVCSNDRQYLPVKGQGWTKINNSYAMR